MIRKRDTFLRLIIITTYLSLFILHFWLWKRRESYSTRVGNPYTSGGGLFFCEVRGRIRQTAFPVIRTSSEVCVVREKSAHAQCYSGRGDSDGTPF